MFAYQTSEDNGPTPSHTMIDTQPKDDSRRFNRPLGVTLIAIWYLASSVITILLIMQMSKFDGWVGLVQFTAIIGVGLSFGLWRMLPWVRKVTIVCAFLSLLLDVTAIFPLNMAIVLASLHLVDSNGYWDAFLLSALLGPIISCAIIVYMALPGTECAFRARKGN